MRVHMRVLSVAFVVLAASVVAITARAPSASAAQSPTAWSWYVEVGNNYSGDVTMESLGCNQARSQNNLHYTSMVILDFGGMYNNSGYQEEINGIVLSPTQIETLTEWYMNGYRYCLPHYVNYVAIGTNNSIPTNSTEGAAFANTVKAVSRWAATYSPFQAVRGANDIESWCPGCVPSSETYSWERGYASQGPPPYINYGSADGCPLTVGGNCNGNWNEGDYYNLSWGLPLADSAPEIYVGVQAAQWAYISRYGSGTYRGPMSPRGPLDEHDLDGSTNGPGQAWSELAQYFPNIKFSMEMHVAG